LLNINKPQVTWGSDYSAQTPRKHSPIKSCARKNRQRSLEAEKVKKRVRRTVLWRCTFFVVRLG